MDWNNHNCHHAETLLKKKKPPPNENIIFTFLKTYVCTGVQETVTVWLSHIAGTNRMMVFVPGSLNKLKLPKVKLKLQVKVLSYFF